MPSLARTDLLSATRSMLRAAFWLDIGVLVLLAVLLAGLMGSNAGTTITLSGSAAQLPPEARLFAARVAITGALIVGLLLLPLLRQVVTIVDSARAGDPFVPENGPRLRHIAWLLLAINVVGNLTVSIALQAGVRLPPVSFTAAVTVLMIFVIARIFDTGSAMRAELRDTV